MNTTKPSSKFIPVLRLAVLSGAVAAIAGCTTPAGGEVTVAPNQPSMESKDKPGPNQTSGGVDILRYNPPAKREDELRRGSAQ